MVLSGLALEHVRQTFYIITQYQTFAAMNNIGSDQVNTWHLRLTHVGKP